MSKNPQDLTQLQDSLIVASVDARETERALARHQNRDTSSMNDEELELWKAAAEPLQAAHTAATSKRQAANLAMQQFIRNQPKSK